MADWMILGKGRSVALALRVIGLQGLLRHEVIGQHVEAFALVFKQPFSDLRFDPVGIDAE